MSSFLQFGFVTEGRKPRQREKSFMRRLILMTLNNFLKFFDPSVKTWRWYKSYLYFLIYMSLSHPSC